MLKKKEFSRLRPMMIYFGSQKDQTDTVSLYRHLFCYISLLFRMGEVVQDMVSCVEVHPWWYWHVLTFRQSERQKAEKTIRFCERLLIFELNSLSDYRPFINVPEAHCHDHPRIWSCSCAPFVLPYLVFLLFVFVSLAGHGFLCLLPVFHLLSLSLVPLFKALSLLPGVPCL